MKTYKIELKANEEQAVYLWHIINGNDAAVMAYCDKYGEDEIYKQFRPLAARRAKGDLWCQVDDALTQQGLNVRLYRHEAPLSISGHPVEFRDDSIRVGCTVVPKETVKAIAQRLGLIPA